MPFPLKYLTSIFPSDTEVLKLELMAGKKWITDPMIGFPNCKFGIADKQLNTEEVAVD
jgi:hypothetical protein